MEGSSAPPFEPEEGGQPRVTNMPGDYFGWGQVPSQSFPSYPPGNPYPPSYPPPMYTPGNGMGGTGGGSSLYPNIGFQPGFVAPQPMPPPSYGGYQSHNPLRECPICRQMLVKPIYQCQNGHVMCAICIGRLEHCSECHVSLEGPKIRNRTLEALLKGGDAGGFGTPYPYHQVTEVKCPNAIDGCDFASSSGGLENHLAICDFRGVPFCRKLMGWPDCSALVNPTLIVGHLQEAHQIVQVTKDKFILKLFLPQDSLHHSASGVTWDPLLIGPVLENDVLIRCALSQGHLLISSYLLRGNVHDAKKYRVKFEINSRSKMSRIEWTGSLLSYRHLHHHDSEFLPNVNAFRLPLNILQQFSKSLSPEDSELEQPMLKLRVCIWDTHDDSLQPFRECFRELESGAKLPLETITLFSSTPADSSYVEPYLYDGSDSHQITSSYASETDNVCHHCSRSIHGVIYQCLQCPAATYFCNHCIEVANVHMEHLTIRMTPGQIPLAAVVYESAAGEI